MFRAVWGLVCSLSIDYSLGFFDFFTVFVDLG